MPTKRAAAAAAPVKAHGDPVITRDRYVQLICAAVKDPSAEFMRYVGTVWDNAGGPGTASRRKVPEIWCGHAMALAELTADTAHGFAGVFPGEPDPAARRR